jgi:hypothetical protein
MSCRPCRRKEGTRQVSLNAPASCRFTTATVLEDDDHAAADGWSRRPAPPKGRYEMIVSRRTLLGSLALAVPLAPASAESLPPPAGEVLLTVAGKIGLTNGDGLARLDRAQLLAWGTDRLRTVTPWDDGEVTFEGVRGSRLLAALKADGSVVRCKALNDYSVDIPLVELREYAVLFALQRDGRPFSVRERGPVWVAYPWSQHPELDDRLRRQRSIWQLTEILVE